MQTDLPSLADGNSRPPPRAIHTEHTGRAGAPPVQEHHIHNPYQEVGFVVPVEWHLGLLSNCVCLYNNNVRLSNPKARMDRSDPRPRQRTG